MAAIVQELKDFLASARPIALVEVADTKGSTPREKGAFMLVSSVAIHGTIGGGQLEYMAIDKARQLLRSQATPDGIDASEPCVMLDVPLGPEIGQCCGGRVKVSIRPVDDAITIDLAAAAERQEGRLPHVYVFGGGHVGKALAASIALLPVHAVVVETRPEELEDMPDGVEKRLTPMPETVVRKAPAGSAFAVLTHDHALDFLIVAEALKRNDAAYVGMIGSGTKKATFRSWFLKTAGGTEDDCRRLVSPIGGDTVKDKRPAVIAALAAAEIMTAVAAYMKPAGARVPAG